MKKAQYFKPTTCPDCLKTKTHFFVLGYRDLICVDCAAAIEHDLAQDNESKQAYFLEWIPGHISTGNQAPGEHVIALRGHYSALSADMRARIETSKSKYPGYYAVKIRKI